LVKVTTCSGSGNHILDEGIEDIESFENLENLNILTYIPKTSPLIFKEKYS
jgi:hypothetical protein